MATAVAVLAAGTAFAIARSPEPFRLLAPSGQHSAGAAAAAPQPTAQVRADLAALARARKSGHRVVVAALTTPVSRTVANPDGTLSETDSVLPVRVWQHGAWQQVSADLVRSGDGTWRPRATASGVSLSGGGAGPLAVLASGTGQRLSLYFPARLPAPAISGPTATYRSVWPGTDLLVTVTRLGGLTWTVIARNAAAAASPALRRLKLRISAIGLTVSTDRAGNLRAAGLDGAARFSGPPVMMWDSRRGGREHAGLARSTATAPGRAARAALVPARVNGLTLSLAPASRFLSGTTAYPVYLAASITPDAIGAAGAGPGIRPGAGGSASPAPGASTSPGAKALIAGDQGLTLDAAINTTGLNCGTTDDQNQACSGANNGFVEVQGGGVNTDGTSCKTNTNYDQVQGATGYQGNGIGYNWWDSYCVGPYRSFYQFNTSGINASTLGVSKVWVQSAKLTAGVHYGADWTCSDTWPVNLKWTGVINSGTNWNNQPSVDANNQTRTYTTKPGPNPNSSCAQQTIGFDVKYAMSQAANSNYANMTFGFYGDETASSSSSNIGFMRIGNSPSITTTFDLNPPAPTNLAVSPASHYEPGGPDRYGCGAASDNLPWVGHVDPNASNPNSALHLEATIASSITNEQVRAGYTMWDNNAIISDPAGTNGGDSSSAKKWSDWHASGFTTSTPINFTLQDGHQYTWTAQAFVNGMSNMDTYPDPGYWSPKPANNPCGFNYDGTPPDVPQVSSSDFPASGEGSVNKLAGDSGTFSFTSADPSPGCSGCQPASGVYEFAYSLNGAISTAAVLSSTNTGCSYATATSGVVRADSSDSATSCPVTVGDWGTNILYVEAIDKAGNVSATYHYYFYAPWNPNKKDVPGDVNADGIPDMLATNGSDLTLYVGNTDPAIQPVTASKAGRSPDGTAWSTYKITHRGPMSQVSASGNADDLFAQKGASLYLYENNPRSVSASPQFEDTSAIIPVPRPACTGADCTGYADDWSGVTQILAPGDAWNPTPGTSNSASAGDTGQPSLLTVENGQLWLYQGNYAPGLQDPVELGSSGWDGVTLVAPGAVGGRLAIWAYDSSTGDLYSYPVYLVNGIPSLTSGSTSPRTATSGTVVFTNPAPGQDAVASPGALDNSSYPGLFIATPPGSTTTYPVGTISPDLIVSNTWVPPATIGGSVDAAGGTCPNGCLWYYPGQSTSGGAAPLQAAPVFVGDLYSQLNGLS